jgi:hypothetical protein
MRSGLYPRNTSSAPRQNWRAYDTTDQGPSVDEFRPEYELFEQATQESQYPTTHIFASLEKVLPTTAADLITSGACSGRGFSKAA